jgi:hypothetical protein
MILADTCRTTIFKSGSGGKRTRWPSGITARLSVCATMLVPRWAIGLTSIDAATYDLDQNKRTGTRSVSLGERPYLDPKSISRREHLAQVAEAGNA